MAYVLYILVFTCAGRRREDLNSILTSFLEFNLLLISL